MKKVFIVSLTAVLLTLNLDARPRGKHVVKEKEGQRYYLDACSKCHGSGNMGGNMATSEEWKDIFSNGAKELISLHKGEDGADSVISYIESKKFKKESPRLLKFLQEFANDSENIPTCY